MRVHILQHVPFEDIGSIRSWLEARNVETTYTRFFENDNLPPHTGLGLIVIMGGPMSVNDEDAFRWLIPEKTFIRDAIQDGIPTIGICLGAQLIAGALGARVHRNPDKEIGWFPVTFTPHAESVFPFPSSFPAFHWHGETFDLPPGSIHLARSNGCENQAFRIGRHVVGLQFHLETTPQSLEALISNCRGELSSGPFIQTEEEMRRVPGSTYVTVNNLMSGLLSYVTGAN